jgi:uncharacterized protein (DUF1501 family)
MNPHRFLSRPTTRRAFLQASGGALGYLSLTRSLSAFPSFPSFASPKPDRVLVLIHLTGGNDGLNTVIPFNDPDYYRLRPTLAVPSRQVLPITPNLGLNPACSGLHSLFEAGMLSLIQGVGAPLSHRSHFRAQEVWDTAMIAPQQAGTGWLGRYLDLMDSANPDNRTLAVHYMPDQPSMLRQAGVNCQSAFDPFLGNFRETLLRISQKIASEDSPRVYFLSLGGFDTHAHQANPHTELLRIFSDGVHAFQQELAARGVARQVMTMAYSEFGRSAAENENRGTDHGTHGPVFIMGSAVHGGVTGETPPLSNLIPDETPAIDFRQIYAGILDDWLGCSAEQVLGSHSDKLTLV